MLQEIEEKQNENLERMIVVFLLLAITLITLWAIARFIIHVPENILLGDVNIPSWLILEMPVWLAIGILIAKSSRKSSHSNQSVSLRMQLLGGLVGWLVVIFFWGVPIVLPGLKIGNLGVGIELTQEAPTFWAAIAFLLGYFSKVTLKIPLVVWTELKKTFFEDNANDNSTGVFWKNVSSFLKGLQGLLKPGK